MKGKKSFLVLVLLGLIMVAIHLRSAGAETTNCTAITSLPYTISTQGIYCLTSDLSTGMASGNAIEIDTNNVVIDLNGHKLGGLAAGPETQANGIYVNQRKNITVRNGTVRGFYEGIYLNDSSPYTTSQGHLIEDIRADTNTFVGIEVHGLGNIIRNNQVVNTGGSTLSYFATGILAYGPGARVLNNDVIETKEQSTGCAYGIALYEASGAAVQNNRTGNSSLGPGTSYGIIIETSANLNPNPPTHPVRFTFIHHSTGEHWLDDGNGRLGIALRDNNYFVSDTNYGWGPTYTDNSSTIGDHTDIGNWWEWFRGPNSSTYLAALYDEGGQTVSYSRLPTAPLGQNEMIMFKSCFPNSGLQGSPNDPVPSIDNNPLRGESSGSEYHTVANAKGIYIDILEYFRTRQDKLFVVITAPPLMASETNTEQAANARALNNWLINEWLTGYPYKNVAVFDFYNVLTSNGGDADTNDLGSETGNHHRWWNGAIQHIQTVDNNTAAYPTGDSHPSQAGNLKATGEFLSLLNIAYHRWKGDTSAGTDDVLVSNNRVTTMNNGVCYHGGSAPAGKYRDNLTSGVTTPYTGGTDGGNNN